MFFWIWGDARRGLIKSSENIYLKACSVSFTQSTECLLLGLHTEPLSECVEGQLSQQLVFNPWRGRWQVPIFSWHCFSRTVLSLCWVGQLSRRLKHILLQAILPKAFIHHISFLVVKELWAIILLCLLKTHQVKIKL